MDENGQIIPYALVEIHELDKKTQTDLNGVFIFKNLVSAAYHLHIQSIGFEFFTTEIELKKEDFFQVFKLKEAINELHEVVIENSSFKNNQSESSISITTISEDDLLKNGAPTLMNALENIEGVQSINTGVGISKPVIRGFSNNRVQVNDAGIKQEGQQWGADHGLELDQYNIENVEVIKGPATLAYGSDAIGGVIHIKKASSIPKNSITSGVNGIYRSVNNTVGSSAYFKANKNDYILRGRVTVLDYGDYKVPTNKYTYKGFVFPIENNSLKNTAGKELNTALSMGITRKWGYSYLNFTNYHQKTGIFPGSTGIPQGYSLLSDGNSRNIALPYQETSHTKIISNNSFTLFKKWVELDLGFQFNNRTEASKPHQHGIPIDTNQTIATNLKLTTTTLNTKIHHKTTPKTDWISGIQTQIQQNNVSGYEFILPKFNSEQIGIYTLVNKTISNRLTINTGLRVDYAHQNCKETPRPFYYNKIIIDTIFKNASINRNYLNYSYGLGLSSTLKKDTYLKFNFGKTFRTPQLIELTANGEHLGAFRFEKGNPTLHPEEAYQFDIVFLIERKNVHFSFTPFANYFSNYIYLKPAARFAGEWIKGDFYPYASGGQLYEYTETTSLQTGFESSIHWHFSPLYTIGGSIEYTQATNLKTEKPLPMMPPLAFKPFLEWESESKNKRNMYYNVKFQSNVVASQTRVDLNENTTNGYSTFDLHTGLGFRKNRNKLQLNFSILNLSNKKYLNHLSRYRIANIPEPGRSYNITFTYTFL